MPTYNESFSSSVAAVKARTEALAPTAEAKDLVFLGKALEAMNIPQAVSEVIDEGDFQEARVTAEGDTQNQRVIDQGNAQLAFLFDAGSVPILFKNAGDTLESARINWLTQAGTFNLPAANSLVAGQYIIAEKPDKYASNSSTVTVNGSDTISYRDGTTDSLIIDAKGTVTVRFVSDGISDWSI